MSQPKILAPAAPAAPGAPGPAAAAAQGAAVPPAVPRSATDGKSYVGKAGHLAAMGEFALRGYNVALPEIDKGDDIFVVNDATGTLWRVQVKTSSETRQKKSSRYGFRMRKASVTTNQVPDSTFVFVMRCKGIWRFCVIARADLEAYRAGGHLTESRDAKTGIDYLQASLVLHDDGKALLAKQSVAKHLEDWAAWPIL